MRAFFQANRNLVRKLETYLPQARERPMEDYEEAVGRYLNRLAAPIILDIGGGRECVVRNRTSPGARIICLDVSAEQLAHNKEADLLLLADATQKIPLPEASVDLVISRMVMEHLESPCSFIQHSYRVLKPGGYWIHIFPGKFAPFALINQLLPHSLSQKILFYFYPDYKNVGGFLAYYRSCYYSAMKKSLERAGFSIKEAKFYYYQSSYFEFFAPLFLISAAYEVIIRRIKNLAAFLLIIAQKPIL